MSKRERDGRSQLWLWIGRNESQSIPAKKLALSTTQELISSIESPSDPIRWALFLCCTSMLTQWVSFIQSRPER